MQPSTNNHHNNGAIKPEPDMEKYKDYKAYMDRKFEESKATDKYRAEYQARKDAKLAREAAQREEEKPLKAEPETAEETLASVPPIEDAQSDDEIPIQNWNPRQHRREQSGGEVQNKDVSAIPSRQPSLSTVTDMPSGNASAISKTKILSLSTGADEPAGNTANPGPSPRRVTLGDIPKNNGGFSRAVEPPPTSRRSSTSSTSSLPDRRKRPAESALQDDRRASGSKHARKSSSAAPPQLATTDLPRGTGVDRRPPKWYTDLPKPKGTREAHESGSETALQRMKDHIKKAKISRQLSLYNDILEDLHRLIFLPVSDKLLRKTRMLDNHDGTNSRTYTPSLL